MNNRLLNLCVIVSFLLNLILSWFVGYVIIRTPVFTGNYQTEDINLVARIQRANFLGEVLKKQFEVDGGKNLPIIISQLAQNSNPQLWLSGEYGLFKMDSRSFIVLTKEETEAVIAHELAHIILGHPLKKPNNESDIKEEQEADNFAVRYVSRRALVGAIEKLSHNDNERTIRIEAIGN